MNLKAGDLNKTGGAKIETPVKKAEKKKTISDEFLEELDTEQSAIFNQLKTVLIEQCDKYEFEAVTEESIDDFALIIEYIQNGIITIENDGVSIKLRKPLKNNEDVSIADRLKILFERNESREKIFTKGIKVSKKNTQSQIDFTLATLAASFDHAGDVLIGVDLTKKLQKSNHRDYLLLLNCYNFFRS